MILAVRVWLSCSHDALNLHQFLFSKDVTKSSQVRRNQHRLAATPDTAATVQVMDQATRAILAVFISNMLLGLPHSIYHLLPRNDNSALSYIPMHIIFFTHLFVDPLVFVCFNLHHRQRVLQAFKTCLQCVTCKQFTLPRATSTLPLYLTSSSSSSSSWKLQQERIWGKLWCCEVLPPRKVIRKVTQTQTLCLKLVMWKW